MALGNLPITANGLPLVAIGNDIQVRSCLSFRGSLKGAMKKNAEVTERSFVVKCGEMLFERGL